MAPVAGPWRVPDPQTDEHNEQQIQHRNAEQPRLYKLVAELAGTAAERNGRPRTVEQPFGFRQIEVKGRVLTINGKPVKYRGVNRLSAHPLMGRAITAEVIRQDAEMIKDANFNMVRATIGPPHPASLNYADELGLYIENEGPACWGKHAQDLRCATLYRGIMCEFLEREGIRVISDGTQHVRATAGEHEIRLAQEEHLRRAHDRLDPGAAVKPLSHGRQAPHLVGQLSDVPRPLEEDEVLHRLLGEAEALDRAVEATRRIKEEIPYVRIVILTVSDADQNLFEAIKSGAQGYLLKKIEPQTLFSTLRKVVEGEAPMSGIMATKLLAEFSRQTRRTSQPPTPVATLTEREKEVLHHIAHGKTNKDIAAVLSIAENTVKNHLKNILEKLHLDNRVQAATYALREGLIQKPAQEKV